MAENLSRERERGMMWPLQALAKPLKIKPTKQLKLILHKHPPVKMMRAIRTSQRQERRRMKRRLRWMRRIRQRKRER